MVLFFTLHTDGPSSSTAFAYIDSVVNGPFELDGNVVTDNPGSSDDWDEVYFSSTTQNILDFTFEGPNEDDYGSE